MNNQSTYSSSRLTRKLEAFTDCLAIGVIVVFLITLVVVPVPVLGALVTPQYSPDAVPFPGVLVWSNSFEQGVQSGWNWYPEQKPQGVGLFVSNQIVENGKYSGYFYYIGSANTQGISVRAYPSEMLNPRPAKFYVQLWVYVPSSVNGVKVSIANWISFASLWLNLPPVYPYNGPNANPITIDSFSNRQLALWLGPLKTSSGPSMPYYVYQKNAITWPFDKWFSIGIYGELHLGTSNSKIVLYQNGQPIITYQGNLGQWSTGLGQMHYGLYADPSQTTFAIYNDYIRVYQVS